MSEAKRLRQLAKLWREHGGTVAADLADAVLDRLVETERERDGAREAAATSAAGHMHWLQRGEAAEARLASSTVLSREDTEKLRKKLEHIEAVATLEPCHGQRKIARSVRAALALLDGRKEET